MLYNSPEKLRKAMSAEKENNTTDVVLWVLIIAMFALVILRGFVYMNVVVDGDSMEPNLHDGDFLTGNRYAAEHGLYTYGDIVVIEKLDPITGSSIKIIKRVIGLGGDVIDIRGGKVYRNGVAIDESYLPLGLATYHKSEPDAREFPYTVPEDEVFVLGDNRTVSVDSRSAKYRNIKREEVILVIPDWAIKMKEFRTKLYNFRIRLSKGCGA